jgi:hypothetical protein
MKATYEWLEIARSHRIIFVPAAMDGIEEDCNHPLRLVV